MMYLKKILTILSLVITISALSQTNQHPDCEDKIESLYHKQGIHLIFCSYYFESARVFSGADSILHTLTFYRDTSNALKVRGEDLAIINNLKKEICNKDTSVIKQMEQWCRISRKIAEIRYNTNFTLEGYMELLYKLSYTTSLISSHLTKDRTIYSLSTDEMEWIYFNSITVIRTLPIAKQNMFFNKMKRWHFL